MLHPSEVIVDFLRPIVPFFQGFGWVLQIKNLSLEGNIQRVPEVVDNRWRVAVEVRGRHQHFKFRDVFLNGIVSHSDCFHFLPGIPGCVVWFEGVVQVSFELGPSS